VDLGTYGKHRKDKPGAARLGPEQDAYALANSKGYFVLRTNIPMPTGGTRKSYALMQNGGIVAGLRDCRLHEIRSYLEKLK
jgi:hypothetical protein